MLLNLIALALSVVDSKVEDNPSLNQLVLYKEDHPNPPTLTTSSGAPVDFTDVTTLNSDLLRKEYFMDLLTHLVRERIPLRLVHTKGAGAFGYFEVTHDITDVCKSKLFSKVGKRTPVAARFSLASSQSGIPDSKRATHGFALKFYTEEGNFDLITISAPVFFLKDPIKFASLTHALLNPVSNVDNNVAIWDYITKNPESFFQFVFLFGDTSIPSGYRHMASFSVHTYQVANEKGDLSFIRYHIIPNADLKVLRYGKAKRIGAEDRDYASRDLYNAIAKGKYPSWNISIQVLTMDDVKNAEFDVFDLTKLLPVEKYPLRPVGTLVLNRNPNNYFAEVEQLAFCVGNFVNGMYGAPDKVFEARRFLYKDTQYHRLGTNFNKIPVNCPFQTKAFTYNRDSVAPVGNNGGGAPNYFPNSFNGPQPYVEKDEIELIQITQDESLNFDQVKYFYLNETSAAGKCRLVRAIVFSLSQTPKKIQDRAVKLFKKIYPDFGARVAKGLKSPPSTDE